MIPVSLRWASNSSSDMAAFSGGSKAWNAVSKPVHLLSMTFQLKPAWKTHLVIWASQRSSGVAINSSTDLDRCSATKASRVCAPPLRSAARA